MKNYNVYFGYSDAKTENEESLILNYYEPTDSIINNIKYRSGLKDNGICIIVAPKGGGKTEIRRVLKIKEEKNKANVWVIDNDFTRRFSTSLSSTSQIRNEIIGLLLTGIIKKFYNKELGGVLEDIKNRVTKFLADDNKIKVKFIELNLAELFKDNTLQFEQTTLDDNYNSA